MKPIIKVRDLSKSYKLHHLRNTRPTLRDALIGSVGSHWPFLKNRGSLDEVLWALRDVSFDAEPGEVIGIIGRNGAGKSTLLKILARVTNPSGGEIDIYGQVGSLLEIGTGFHPDLTGRENIYLNAAILGMKRREVRRKFDEIVAFAEVDDFLDMPVKFYSSGMYVRLAFAIAVHVETQILLLDEVLAVGDVVFQQKCLAKMKEVSGDGRTVFLVSHNMAMIQELCNRIFVLRNSKLIESTNRDHTIASLIHALHIDSNLIRASA